MTPALQLPVIAPGARFKVGATRISVPFPVPDLNDFRKQVVQVELRSDADFSCELVWDSAGEKLYRVDQERSCRILLSLGDKGCNDNPKDPDPCELRHTLHLWTVGPEATVTADVLIRPTVEGPKGMIPSGKAVYGFVNTPGLYRTGPGVYCAPEYAYNVMKPCGPEAQLGEGTMVFTVFERQDVPLSLEPVEETEIDL